MTLPASAILENIANTALADPSKETLTLGQFIEQLGEKSLPLVTLIFTLLNIFSIPGVSSVLAIIISTFVLQIMVGRKTIWLPGFLARKTIPERALIVAIQKSTPYLKRVENFTKPRFEFLITPVSMVFICALILVLAGIIFLPLSVIGNLLPAFCVSLILIGLLERDGLLVLIGSLAGLVVIAGLYFVIIEAVKFLFGVNA